MPKKPPLHRFMPWEILDKSGGERLAIILETMRGEPLVRHQIGPGTYWLLNDAEAARHVLQENAKAYRKSKTYAFLRPLLGNGLFTSEGEFWKRQRRLAQPAFHPKALHELARQMTTEIDGMLDRWDGLERRGVSFDCAAEMMRLTLAIVGRTLFSADLHASARELGQALTTVLALTERRMLSLVRLPDAVPTRSNRTYAAAIRTIDDLVRGLIAERRRTEQQAPREDLLGMLMAARDDDGQGMTDAQLRDEVMTLVLAGHETTANALSFAFALLSQHPSVARRLREEASSVLGDRAPTAADTRALPFAQAVVSESMRLYPPVWISEREALEPDVLCGYEVPRGTIVSISAYVLHHNEAYWPNPEGFDPDRFLGTDDARPKFAYLPFGGGPRVCIGNAFAQMEATLAVSMVARRFSVELVPGHRVEPELMLTLRPHRGVPVTLRRASRLPSRESAAAP